MRDAFGSTFMFYILIIFIVMFTVFMCFTVSYAKTFRIKNRVIDILEQSQYQGDSNSDWNSIAEGTIKEYLNSSAYNFPGDDHSQVSNHCKNKGGSLTNNGICIISKDTGDNRYYEVFAYIVYYFPLFRFEIVMPVGGSTDVIPVL